jgi:hypothetical protein
MTPGTSKIIRVPVNYAHCAMSLRVDAKMTAYLRRMGSHYVSRAIKKINSYVIMTNKQKSANQRKAKERESKKRAGFVRMEIWIKPEWKEEIRKKIEELIQSSTKTINKD